MSKRLFSVLCLVLFIASGNGCRRSSSGLLAYVPADSAAIMIVKWAAVRNDNDLKSMVNGNEFEGQIRRLGVDSSAVDELVIFAAGNSKAAMLLHGSFDRRKVADQLKSSGWSESSIEGQKVYSKADDYVSFPADGVLAAGLRDGVTAAAETGRGSGKSIESAPSFRGIKDELKTGKSPVMGFLIAPEGTLEMADAALAVTAGAMSFFGYGEIGTILKKLNIASGAGFSVARASSSQKYAVNFCVMMRDEEAAVIAAGALKVMKSLSSFVATPNDKENLGSFSVSRRKKVLSIQMEMPREALMPTGR